MINHLVDEVGSVELVEVEEDLAVRVRGEHHVRAHGLKVTTEL